ncbi:MAG: DinB family protein [Proteobacteria bacterium]|nr:DinB family protein [Pseudomonadota bacterium]
MSDSFLLTLFEHKAWCNRQLVEALRAVPSDADRGRMTVILFTLDHTSKVDQIFKGHLSGTEHGLNSVLASQLPDLDALAAKLGEVDAWYIDYAKRVSSAELEAVVEFSYVSDADTGRMTRAEMLAHVVTHGASHRGAIGKMLEGMALPGAADMVTTFQRQRLAARDDGDPLP